MRQSSVFQRYLLPGFVFQSVVIAGGYGTGRELVEFFLTQGPLGGLLAMLLVSTVSAMTLAGPRVLQVIGEDFPAFRWLGKRNANDIPATAIGFQALLAVLFILSGSFESVLVFAGFTLALNSFVTVLGVFVLRWRQPDLPRPYRTFAYPITPLIYLALTGWTLIFVLMSKATEGLFGLGVIATGLLVYALVERRQPDLADDTEGQ